VTHDPTETSVDEAERLAVMQTPDPSFVFDAAEANLVVVYIDDAFTSATDHLHASPRLQDSVEVARRLLRVNRPSAKPLGHDGRRAAIVDGREPR